MTLKSAASSLGREIDCLFKYFLTTSCVTTVFWVNNIYRVCVGVPYYVLLGSICMAVNSTNLPTISGRIVNYQVKARERECTFPPYFLANVTRT